MNKSLIFVCVVLSCLFSCNNNRVKSVFYENSKQIKEQYRFFDNADTSNYEYLSFYHNGQKKSEGMIVASRKDGVWKEWYEDGVFRGEFEYNKGQPVYSRKLPVVILDQDSIFAENRVKIKVLNLYPDQTIVSDGMIYHLKEDPNYDYEVIPFPHTDSLGFYFFSPFIFDKADTIYIDISDVHEPEKYGIGQGEFEYMKSENIGVKLIEQQRKMLTLKKVAIYEK